MANEHAKEFKRIITRCRILAQEYGLDMNDQDLAVAALYVVLSSYGSTGNPFLLNLTKAIKEFPFNQFNSLVSESVQINCGISSLYPYIDAAFWEIHKEEWIRYIIGLPFFRRYFSRAGEKAGIGYKHFVDTCEYSRLFSEWFDWDFQKKEPYPAMEQSLCDTYYIMYGPESNIPTRLITSTIVDPRGQDGIWLVTPLRHLYKTPEARAVIEDMGRLNLSITGHHNESVKGCVTNRIVPDLLVADDRYLAGRYDWGNSREVRVITADGIDKVMDKGKYEGWLDKYVADRFIPLSACFKKDPGTVEKLLRAFESEGYIRTIESGMRYEWLHPRRELACLLHEMWYTYGEGKTVPSKTISRYFCGYKDGEQLRQELHTYRFMCPDEWGSNWNNTDKFDLFVLQRGNNDNYVRILKIIRKIVHADGA